MWYIIGMGNHRAKGGFTPLLLGGCINALQTKERRAIRMNVTYADLFQFCIFVVALVSLCYQVFKDKKK